MSARGRSGLTALLVSFAAIAGVSACDGDAADGGGDDAGSGGTLVAGATASGGGAGRGGATASGGTSGSGNGLTAGSGGSRNVAGAAGRGGGPATGGTGGDTGDSPYEIECHGDTVMCGNPTSLLCLGLRAGTEVFGYSCSHECQSDADCSDRPASAEAAAGCVDFVNKKYCLLVCKNGDEQASCPTGMYCYVYEGAPIGYCLWR